MKNNDVLVWVLIAIVVILIFGGFGMMGFGGYGSMMGMMYGYGLYGFASLFDLAYKILILAALILFVVWLWQKIGGKK